MMHRQTHLPEIVAAMRPARCLTSRLYSRQKNGNQDPDDGNHDQQFN
jgi:hypothetical protein